MGQKDLTEILYDESMVVEAFILRKEPFKYIDRTYSIYKPSLPKEWWIDFALDIYNWYIRENVLHDTKHKALYQAGKFMIGEYYDERGE